MQVEPIDLTFKVPGSVLLKVQYDRPLSNVAFKFNLRCYTKGVDAAAAAVAAEAAAAARLALLLGVGSGDNNSGTEDMDASAFSAPAGAGTAAAGVVAGVTLGKAVQVEPMKRMLNAFGPKRSKLRCDELLSRFSFKL